MSRIIALCAAAVAVVCALAVVSAMRKPSHPKDPSAPSPLSQAVGEGETGLTPVPGSFDPKGPMSAGEREKIAAFWAVYQKATAAFHESRWADAEAGYRRALELNPTHWDSLYYLGNSLVEQRRFAPAEAAYQRLAKSDPVAGRAYSALGSLYANDVANPLFDLKKAGELYRRASRANGDESGPVERMGEVALATGDDAKAAEYLGAAGRTNPKSVESAFLLGYLAQKRGDKAKADAQLAKAVKLTQEQPPPAGVLGEGDTKLAGQKAMVRPASHGIFDVTVRKLWPAEGTPPATPALYDELKARVLHLRSLH